MVPVLPLLKRPDAMVTGNAGSIRSVKRDQFVGLTIDAFTSCPSLTPPMQHRDPSASSGYDTLPRLRPATTRPYCPAATG
jgi:hypothetical protein